MQYTISQWRVDSSQLAGCRVRYMTDAVLWARFGFRLRFERMAEGDVRPLEWQLQCMRLCASKLGNTMNLHIVGFGSRLGGLGWTPWYDRVVADQLAMAERYLNGTL